MLPMLAGMLGSALSGAGGGGGDAAATPDTVTVDTGDTNMGGPMSLGGGGGASWVPWLVLGLVALFWMKSRR